MLLVAVSDGGSVRSHIKCPPAPSTFLLLSLPMSRLWGSHQKGSHYHKGFSPELRRGNTYPTDKQITVNVSTTTRSQFYGQPKVLSELILYIFSLLTFTLLLNHPSMEIGQKHCSVAFRNSKEIYIFFKFIKIILSFSVFKICKLFWRVCGNVKIPDIMENL